VCFAIPLGMISPRKSAEHAPHPLHPQQLPIRSAVTSRPRREQKTNYMALYSVSSSPRGPHPSSAHHCPTDQQLPIPTPGPEGQLGTLCPAPPSVPSFPFRSQWLHVAWVLPNMKLVLSSNVAK